MLVFHYDESLSHADWNFAVRVSVTKEIYNFTWHVNSIDSFLIFHYLPSILSSKLIVLNTNRFHWIGDCIVEIDCVSLKNLPFLVEISQSGGGVVKPEGREGGSWAEVWSLSNPPLLLPSSALVPNLRPGI